MKSKQKAGGIIYSLIDKIKILVVKGRSHDKWSIPKGKIKKGETFEECAHREIYEETGLDTYNISFVKSIKIDNCVCFLHEIDNIFIDNNHDLKTNDDNEIEEVKWMDLDELKKNKCNRILTKIINKNHF
jgi:8-oxo-dGTP pyrophosphatase MutT (NUDIX family)